MKKLPKVEQDGWYTAIHAPAYWMELIGRIKGVVRIIKKVPVYRVEFLYRKDGSRLNKPELFDFEEGKLKLVKDFSARIKRHNPKPPRVEADEYEIVEEGTITSEVSAWQKESVCKDVLFVSRASLEKEDIVICANNSEALKVASTSDQLVRVAVNIPNPRSYCVGPHFDPYDSPENWLRESGQMGFSCVCAKIIAKRWAFYIFDKKNAALRIRKL